MVILALFYLQANEIIITININSSKKIEIIIGPNHPIIFDVSQSKYVNFLSSLNPSNDSNKLIDNISKINIIDNLDNQITQREHHQVHSILFYYIIKNISKDITTLEFNIQRKIVLNNFNTLILRIISNLTEFTELNNLSIAMDDLFVIKINLQDFLFIYHYFSISNIINQIQENTQLKHQLLNLSISYTSSFVTTYQKNEAPGREDIIINGILKTLLLDFTAVGIDDCMEDIIDYYNRYSNKIFEHSQIDPAILLIQINQLLDQKLFDMYNRFFFPTPNNLN